MPGGMSFAYPLGWKFPEPPKPPREPLWRIFLALIAEEVRNWRKLAACRLLDHDVIRCGYCICLSTHLGHVCQPTECRRCGKRWP